ncbi:hypothetical protein RHGRI_008464 [Rhododendron griersonianum]|uniref:Uncharacterized protein n=1 Tax=Rhododendron griersonianum TaxID=479676 RepID=A0AAV6L0Y2_9ERIC|nr:hypothetical protein RHGRI_008464 [Rhododendron griersonianum]
MVLEFIASSGQGAAMELRLVGEMQRAGHVAVGDRLTYVSSSEDSRRKKGTRKTRLPSLKPLLSYGVLSKRIEMENLEKQFQSSETFPNSTFGWVNVKDVANAHVQAFEIPSAKGRYCIVESVVHSLKL